MTPYYSTPHHISLITAFFLTSHLIKHHACDIRRHNFWPSVLVTDVARVKGKSDRADMRDEVGSRQGFYNSLYLATGMSAGCAAPEVWPSLLGADVAKAEGKSGRGDFRGGSRQSSSSLKKKKKSKQFVPGHRRVCWLCSTRGLAVTACYRCSTSWGEIWSGRH